MYTTYLHLTIPLVKFKTSTMKKVNMKIEKMIEEVDNAIIFMDGKLHDGVWSTYEEREMLETINALSQVKMFLSNQKNN
jgi:hypothetical protein